MAKPLVYKFEGGRILPADFDELKAVRYHANSPAVAPMSGIGINCYGGTLRSDDPAESINQIEGEEVL